MGINVLTASGHIGNDPKMVSEKLAVFSLPVTSGWGDNEVTTWVECKLLGGKAKLAEYLTKGSQVSVTGQLSHRKYESNGQQGTSIEMIVQDIQLPPKGDSQPRQQPQQSYQRQQQAAPPPAQEPALDFSDDVPF